jgi:hypothetical protein
MTEMKDAKDVEGNNAEQKKYNTKTRFFGQRFALTIHGQRQSDYTKLVDFFNTQEVRLACIAREFGKNKIHPHLQVYFELDKRQAMKERIEAILGHEGFHLEVAKGSTSSNVNYVYAVDKVYEGGFVLYNKNCIVPERYDITVSEFWNNIQLRTFQKEILGLVSKPSDRRTIFYFWEEEGNMGKTILAEYLHIFHGAIITGGKSEDMKHAISRWTEITGVNPVIIIVDAARSDKLNADSCKALEAIKNGLFFDGKYESAMAHSFVKPHILIFSNFPPVKEFFSDDRWKIGKINKDYSLTWE